MKRLVIISLILITGLIAISGCKKNNVFSDIPEIRLIEVNPSSVTQFLDSLTIEVEYKDGDGDLGFEHPDSLSLYVLDSRLSAPDWYFVQPLAPLGSKVAIQGNLKFKLRSAFILGNGSSETTIYTIKIKDRANNWSNEIQTPLITINN